MSSYWHSIYIGSGSHTIEGKCHDKHRMHSKPLPSFPYKAPESNRLVAWSQIKPRYEGD